MTTLFHNGKIYSVDKNNTKYSAMEVENGKIVGLFDSVDLNNFKDSRKIDLDGKTILPSMTDSHLHFILAAAQMKIGFQVSEVVSGKLFPTTLQEALKIIEEKVQNCVPNKLNIAANYITTSVAEKRLPTKDELDSVTKNFPLVVYTIDGHSCACNSLALKLLGIDSASHNGLLTGQEHDFMQGKITDTAMSGVNLSIAYKGITLLVNESVKYGIGTLCCLEGYDDAVNDLPMTLATTFMPRLPIKMRLFQQYSKIERAKKNFPLLRKKRIGGCGAWEMDGSVGSRSAAFDMPYLGEPKTCGKLYYSDKDRDEMFVKSAEEGATISTHAIGTLAIEKALDSFEKVTPSGNPLRNRLDHTEFPYAKDVERIIKLNLDVTVQPGYAYLDAKYFHSYESFIEKQVIDRELPLKTLVDGGVNVLGSSDCPVQSLNPFVQMKGMIDCVNESERLTKLQALKTYTVFPSNSLGENNESGSIEVGKNADFGVYRDDYFETAVEKIDEITCEDLYLCGKIVKPMSGGMFEMIKVLLKHKKLI